MGLGLTALRSLPRFTRALKMLFLPAAIICLVWCGLLAQVKDLAFTPPPRPCEDAELVPGVGQSGFWQLSPANAAVICS